MVKIIYTKFNYSISGSRAQGSGRLNRNTCKCIYRHSQNCSNIVVCQLSGDSKSAEHNRTVSIKNTDFSQIIAILHIGNYHCAWIINWQTVFPPPPMPSSPPAVQIFQVLIKLDRFCSCSVFQVLCSFSLPPAITIVQFHRSTIPPAI